MNSSQSDMGGVLASLSIRFISGTKSGVLWKQSRIPDGVSQPNPTLRREMLSEDIERHARAHSLGFCIAWHEHLPESG